MIVIENKIYIPPELAEKADLTNFKKAISLQINQELYDEKYITKEMYERTKRNNSTLFIPFRLKGVEIEPFNWI